MAHLDDHKAIPPFSTDNEVGTHTAWDIFSDTLDSLSADAEFWRFLGYDIQKIPG